MKRWIHANDEIDEIDDDYEWSPYDNGIYMVTAGYESKNTDDPVEAITLWYKGQQTNPEDVMIMCKLRSQAVDLCKAATPELLTKLTKRYKCPYKLSYMIEQAQKAVADGCRGFYENDYGYGDTVHPFGVG